MRRRRSSTSFRSLRASRVGASHIRRGMRRCSRDDPGRRCALPRRENYPRHLLVTIPSLISTKAVPLFSFVLLPPKIRKMAPLESLCSVYLYFHTSLPLSLTVVLSLGSP